MKLQQIKRNLELGIPLKVIIGKTFKLGNLEFTWWGLSQKYKWRWNITHIDLGVVSIYGIKSKLWRILAWLILPLRRRYNKKVVNSSP